MQPTPIIKSNRSKKTIKNLFKQGKSEIHIFDAASGSDSDYDDEGVNSLTSEGDLTKIIENSTSKADLVKI